MELLQHINSLKYKNQIDLLPTIHAIWFNYIKPSKEVVFFEMGSPSNPEELLHDNIERNYIFSIDAITNKFNSLNDGDSFRVVCQSNKLFIIEKITFTQDDKINPRQTMIAKNIYEEKVQ